MAHGENAPLNITPGAIRFNTDSMKLEYFRIGMEGGSTSSYAGIGTLAAGEWVQITTDTPDIQTGGTRGLFAGGQAPDSTKTDAIVYINIATTGNAIDFGDLTIGRDHLGGTSSRTRGIFASGWEQTPSASADNRIDFVTIASTGDATDFGDLSQSTGREGHGTFPSNSTRGILNPGGYVSGGSANNTMDYITMASTGNAVDFGDTSIVRASGGGMSSSTRGLLCGGYAGPVADRFTRIDQFTISTQGNAADFGDLFTGAYYHGTSWNSTRGVVVGGLDSSGSKIDDMQVIFIATSGNSVKWGDLNYTNNVAGCSGSPTRGVVSGGHPNSSNISYFSLTTEGNAIDFGDLTAPTRNSTGCSNGHGGLG